MVKSKKTGGAETQGMTSNQEFLSLKKIIHKIDNTMSTWNESSPESILALETIFLEALKRGDIYLEDKSLNLTPSGKKKNPEMEYKTLLKSHYDKFWEKLLETINNTKSPIRQQALATCINLMTQEGKFPLGTKEKIGYYFPMHRLKLILKSLLSPDHDNTELISKFQELACYKDALYFTWRNILQETPKNGKNQTLFKNVLEVIDKIPLPNPTGKSKFTDLNKGLLCASEKNNKSFDWDEMKLETTKEIIKKLWKRIMKWEKSPEIHLQSLIILVDRIMPNLKNPIFYSLDYLSASIDSGGPIGLIALQGMSILETKHNTYDPQIYNKLYSMLTLELINSKCKARLLHLCDLFFQSKHISEALAAAFIKKLARLTISLTPEDIITVLRFICNLILRHHLEELIDRRKSVDDEVTGDPFLVEEKDPSLSNAKLSSLWEIRMLESHVLPSVATAARSFRVSLPSVEYDLSDTWEKTSGHIFKRETKRKRTSDDVPQTFKRPKSMASLEGELLSEFCQFS